MRNLGFGQGRKSRRGVGGIIAGVILMAIIFTSVLVFFVTISNNDKARFGYEIQAQEEGRDKSTESFAVENSGVSGSNINVKITNNGPIPMVASHMILYCVSGPACSEPSVPITTLGINGAGLTLNAGSDTTQAIGTVASGNTYRVDVISQRGNIVSTTDCEIEGSPFDCTDEGVEGQVNEGIIQGTGSIQLDFKSFGSIFPGLGTRAGVDQRGWDVKTSSPYGSATGYPGFEIPYGLNVIFVEKFRNLDLSGEGIVLHRDTSLLTNIGKEQSNQPDIEYICGVNKALKQTTAYNEKTNNVVLSATPINADRTAGWQEIFFCSKSPGQALNDYAPTNDFNSFHPLFMVIRGHFENTLGGYAQTVPYQSTTVGALGATSFNACLRNANVNTACASPTSNDSTASLRYTATIAEMQTGVGVWVHVNTVTTPVSVSWVYPDGTQLLLADEQTLNANRNVQITLPTKNSDGTDFSCSAGATPGSFEYYVLKVNDEYDSSGRRNVYLMTWRVTC